MDRQNRLAEKAEARKAQKLERKRGRKRPDKVDWFVVALCVIAIIAVGVGAGGRQKGKGLNRPDPLGGDTGVLLEKSFRPESP